jgi:acetylornithine deacetylase/succinyl-diaminopimelate desuccinylase-like protein
VKDLLLLSHIDVVPAENPQWEVGPFEAAVKDGYLYGRGALDNKSMGIVEMMVLLTETRESCPERDIFFWQPRMRRQEKWESNGYGKRSR